MVFQKAVKSRARLRAALSGPSGSGKTYTALAIATGIGGKIAVIDSEHGSASKYADRFDFDVVNLEEKTVDEYIAYINEAGKSGYNVLVIDSLSHAWQELVGDVEKIAKARYHGNTWAAWSEGTPKQRKLIDAIIACPCHIIATMRSKTEWQITTDERNNTKPVRIGLAPEQGKGIEYEFDLLMEISPEHIANVTKDRTGQFQDRLIEKPGEELGKELIEWLNSESPLLTKQKEEAKTLLDELKITDARRRELWGKSGKNYGALIELLKKEKAALQKSQPPLNGESKDVPAQTTDLTTEHIAEPPRVENPFRRKLEEQKTTSVTQEEISLNPIAGDEIGIF